MRQRLAAATFGLLAMLATSGCATCGPFRAAWYLVEEDPGTSSESGSASPTMYVSVLYEGMGDVVVDMITLNPSKDDMEDGWSFGSRVSPLGRTMSGGRFVVLPTKKFKRGTEEFSGCRVPVHVAVQCFAEKRSSWATVSGTMPNYLPKTWLGVTCEDRV